MNLEEKLEDLLLVVDVAEVEDGSPVPEEGQGRENSTISVNPYT